MSQLTGEQIFRLKASSGMSLDQIAEQQNESYNAVRGRYRRYVKRTRKANQQPPAQQQQIQAASETVIINGGENLQDIESNSRRITTLEQLIDYCKIDLSVWTIERHVINKWEVGAKDPATGMIIVEPLFQVKASLVKRHPEAIQPVIQPVNINLHYNRTPETMRGLRAALIVSDAQIGFSREVMRGKLTPFHDRAAMDVVAQIAELVEPETTIVIGDYLDFSGWSDKFIVRPEFHFTTQPALNEGAWYLARLRTKTRGPMMYIEGNHDKRPEVQIISHLVAAYGLRSADQLEAAPVMSIDNLLGLSRMGVNYIGGYPDGEVWLNNTTKVIHGDKVRGQPGQTAAAVVRDANENVVFGHCHRSEYATKTIPGRSGYRTVTAFSPGCLCHVDGRVPGSSKNNQWQQGAAVVYYDDECSTIVPIPIFCGRAIFQGVMYQGRDYVDALRADTNWNF